MFLKPDRYRIARARPETRTDLEPSPFTRAPEIPERFFAGPQVTKYQEARTRGLSFRRTAATSSAAVATPIMRRYSLVSMA